MQVVTPPAVLSKLVSPGFYVGVVDGPVRRFQFDFDPEVVGEHRGQRLDSFFERIVGAVVVLDFGKTLAIRIPCLCERLAGFLRLCSRFHAVCRASFGDVHAVCHISGGDQGIGGGIIGAQYVLDEGLAVDREVECFADERIVKRRSATRIMEYLDADLKTYECAALLGISYSDRKSVV